MNRRGVLLLATKVVFSGLLVWLVLRRVSVGDVMVHISQARAGYVVFCLALAIPTIALSALRWHLLAGGIMSFSAAVKYILIGSFYGAVLPGAVSGDIARGMALAAKDRTLRNVTLPASIIVDRLLGLCALFAISTLGFSLAQAKLDAEKSGLDWMIRWGSAASVLMAFAAAAPFAAWFGRLSRPILARVPVDAVRRSLLGIAAAVATYSGRRGLVLRCLALSVAVHLFTLAGYVAAFRAFGLHVSLLEATIFFSIMSLLLLMPISVSGVGVRDVFAVVFFKSIHGSSEQAVAFSWLLLLLGLTVAGIGAGVQLWEVFVDASQGRK